MFLFPVRKTVWNVPAASAREAELMEKHGVATREESAYVGAISAIQHPNGLSELVED